MEALHKYMVNKQFTAKCLRVRLYNSSMYWKDTRPASALDREVLKKTSLWQHLGLGEMQKRPSPEINSPPAELYADKQIPTHNRAGPDYPFAAYI